MSSMRQRARRTLRALARKPARARCPRRGAEPPCKAIACAAYSIGRATGRSRCAADGAGAMVDVEQWIASHPTPRASPAGTSAAVRNPARAMPARSRVAGSAVDLGASFGSTCRRAERWQRACPRSSACSRRRTQPRKQRSNPGAVRPAGRRHAVAAHARHHAVDPLTDRKAAPAGRIADAQQQSAAGRQCVTHAASTRSCSRVDVVQHIEDHDHVDRAERGRAHVGADELSAPSPSASRGARDVARHQLDAGVAGASAWRPRQLAIAPGAPPSAAGDSRLANRPWPQPMSSTRGARAIRPRASSRRRPDPGPACRARNARRSCRPCCTARSPRRQRAPGGVPSAPRSCAAKLASGNVTARGERQRDRRRTRALVMRSSSGGSTLARPARRPRVRAAWPSCSSRMSPAASPLVRRASTACRIAPRGVEAAPRPAHQLQAQPLQHRREEWIAQPRGGAEEARRARR